MGISISNFTEPDRLKSPGIACAEPDRLKSPGIACAEPDRLKSPGIACAEPASAIIMTDTNSITIEDLKKFGSGDLCFGGIVCANCPNYFVSKNRFYKLCQECVIKQRAERKMKRQNPETKIKINNTNSNSQPIYVPALPTQAQPTYPSLGKYLYDTIELTHDEIVPGYVIQVVYKIIETKDYFSAWAHIYDFDAIDVYTVEFPLPKILTRDNFDDDDNVIDPESIEIDDYIYLCKVGGRFTHKERIVDVNVEIHSAKLIKKSVRDDLYL